jgi:hypothetical protein
MRTVLGHVLFSIFLAYAVCSFSQTTGYSGTGANIDVKYHRFQWTLNPTSLTVSGTVTTYFTTTQDNVSLITFDLSNNYNNASLVVKYHGSSSGVGVSFPTTGNLNILRVTLPVTLPINKLDSVSITYAGTPPLFSDYGEGFTQTNITGLGNAVYTLAESYGDDDFWPCKADMQDKIDSVDFIITTPSTYRAAANGVLVSDVISGANRVMTYKHRYPIASYLIAVAVANYSVYNRTPVTINGTSVPIVYYIGSGRTPTAAEWATMDYCRDQLVAFSSVYGDYPFKKEKYGMYEFGWGGGMEHQTFSAMSYGSMTSWSVVAHELAHQWFGDKVTFATWHHLWLAEGFAQYSEALAAELVPSMGKVASSHRATIKSTALSTYNTTIYLSDASIKNSNTIWTTNNDNAIYKRGAMVVSMLRKLAGDTKFFQALRNYLNDPALAYQSATTDILKNHFESVLGYDLDAFFQDYIYGTGNPAYDVSWGSNGNNINIELTTQRRISSTVSYFRTPVVLRITNGLSGASLKDTLVVIYDQNGQLSYAGNGISAPKPGKVLGYNLSFTPQTVQVDPNAETMVRGQDGATATATRVAQSTVARVAGLNINPIVILPVDIVDFRGHSIANGNLLSLFLSTTSSHESIVLERSDNGNQFHALGKMREENVAVENLTYKFLDEDIEGKSVYYYRAKTVDERGEVSYSKTISISRSSKETDLVISPNPARNYLRISLPVRWQNKQVVYTIYSSNGMVIKKERIVAGNDIKIALGDFSSGNYTIELSNDHSKLSKQFAVIH